MRRILILLFLSSLSWQVHGEVTFYKFVSKSVAIPLLIAVRAGETPQQAWSHYFKELQRNTDMVDLFQGRFPELGYESFQPVSNKELSESPVLIANSPRDYTNKLVAETRSLSRAHENRVFGFKESFAAEGKGQVFLLPIAADIGMSLKDSRSLKNKIAEHVNLLVAMGGDDVHTALYKSEDIWSGFTNRTRDAFEISLIQTFTRRAKGFMLGICRGMQITAVALGYKLFQHLPQQIGSKVTHDNYSFHSVNVVPTRFNFFKKLVTGLSVLVNSLHHQSVHYRTGGSLQPAAWADDGVLEAAEFRNGRGFLTQFHPELMKTEIGRKIISMLIQKAYPDFYTKGECQRFY